MLNRVRNILAGVFYATALCACAGEPGREANDFASDPRPLATTMVYDCSGVRFTARLGPAEMAVWFEDRYLILSQVRAASGVRYEEGETVFWLKGSEGLLILDGQHYPQCRALDELAPWEDARRRGVDLRAAGATPPWSFELSHGRHALFEASDGPRVLLQQPVEQIDPDGTRLYRGGAGDVELRVKVENSPCQSGSQMLPLRVRAEVGKQVFEGCGQDLDYPWE